MKTDLVMNRFYRRRATARPRSRYENPEIQHLNGVNYQNKPTMLGVSEYSRTMGLVYFSAPSSDVALFDDEEPFYIKRLRIKGRVQTLSNKEKMDLMDYYRDADKQQQQQQQKDNRYALNEGYKLTKKFLGLGVNQ